MKSCTLEQVETAQKRAVLAAQNLLQNDDLADEIESMTPEEYAESKGIAIVSNPNLNQYSKGRFSMATLKELRREIVEKDDYIRELEDRLSEITGLATLSDDDDEDLEDEDE